MLSHHAKRAGSQPLGHLECAAGSAQDDSASLAWELPYIVGAEKKKNPLWFLLLPPGIGIWWSGGRGGSGKEKIKILSLTWLLHFGERVYGTMI